MRNSSTHYWQFHTLLTVPHIIDSSTHYWQFHTLLTVQIFNGSLIINCWLVRDMMTVAHLVKNYFSLIQHARWLTVHKRLKFRHRLISAVWRYVLLVFVYSIIACHCGVWLLGLNLCVFYFSEWGSASGKLTCKWRRKSQSFRCYSWYKQCSVSSLATRSRGVRSMIPFIWAKQVFPIKGDGIVRVQHVVKWGRDFENGRKDSVMKIAPVVRAYRGRIWT
jgi:hypothetical protein